MKANEKQLWLRRECFPKGTIRCLAVFIWCFGFLNGAALSGAPAPPYQWVRTAGGSERDKALGVAVDSAGNTYVTGFYQGRATFGGTALGTTGSINFNIFICKIGQTGDFQWVRTSTAPQASGAFCVGQSLAIDNSGNLYVMGNFRGTVTFGTVSIASVKNEDSFVLKLSTNGTPIQAWRLGGVDGEFGPEFPLGGIAVASDGSLYIAGAFQGTAPFGATNLTSAGNLDAFLAK